MKRALVIGLIFVVALGAIFSVLVLRGVISQRDQSFSAVSSQPPAPDFALETLDGTVIQLAQLRGRKVILNFWASWCAPCRAEMPDFERIYQQYGDRLTILGINIQEDRQTLERFLDEVPVSYPILLDPKGTAVQAYKVIAQPATFWIDEHGQILERKYGAYTRAELEERAREFVNKPSTALSQNLSHQERGVGAQRAVPLREVEVRSSNLFEKYFSQYDLEELGVESDPSTVSYVADLDLSLLDLGCPARDCIPSIDRPEFETPTEASSWLKPNDLVVSVTQNGVTKAYPVKILNWHEIVNDDFNGEPLAITFCPLCNSALVFRRPIVEGKILEFGVSGRLYKSDLVMYDRQTASFWSQIEGRAIIGPLAGTRLEYVPTEMMTWQRWQERHSVAWVLARPTVYTAVGGQPGRPKPSQSGAPEGPQASWRGQASRPQIIDPSGAVLSQEFSRDYDYDPYSLYKTDDFNTFGTPFDDERLGAKTTIWGLELNGAAKAYLPEAVAAWGALNDELGGEPLLVLWDGERQMVKFFARRWADRLLTFNRRDGEIIDTETQSIWSADGEALSGSLQGTKLRRLSGIPAFWFAWLAFHPKTGLFTLDSDEAESFFERSNVRVTYDGNSWWLRLDTPEYVLCQVNLADMKFMTLQAMEMTLPATDHKIRLEVRPDRTYRLRLTAITEKLAIYQSKTYEFTAQPMVDPQANLIERTAGSAQIVTPVPAETIFTMPVQISEIRSTSARISFATQVQTISTIAYNSTRHDGRLVRAAQPKPVTEHSVQLLALASDAEYHVSVFLVDAHARVYRSEDYSFKTAVAGSSTTWTPDGENMALLSQGGRITGVSSNWAGGDNDSAFGANKAIDGDPMTEWSSHGDGNNAWIEITLAQPSRITGIGFWTRTMGTSAQISKFRVVTRDGKLLGVFDLPDAKQMYNFDLEDFDGQMVRFEVVESSGGNTGAKEIAIYVQGQWLCRNP